MQQSQRAACNHALEYAIRRADGCNQGVVVGFGLTTGYPEANARHYAFMLQGLAETAARLHDRGIRFVMRAGSPDEVALALAGDASLVVCDRGYLRHQRAWREKVASHAACEVVQVEADVVVPLETACGKAEYAARTLRPKIARRRDDFLAALVEHDPERASLRLPVKGDLDPAAPELLLRQLDLDRAVGPVARFTGGTEQARARRARFLREGLDGYGERRGEPSRSHGSELSPYLHFGQIAPLEVALAARAAKAGDAADRASFLEELIVRRELACNFVYFTRDYDRYEGLPNWARRTLAKHAEDRRPQRFARADLAAGRTDDRYWNAAMAEMRETGFIRYSATPEEAYATALHLNNRYFLDGRDANSYANIGWLFGLHDRPWQERDILGTVRTMTAGRLERKYDIEAYVQQVAARAGWQPRGQGARR